MLPALGAVLGLVHPVAGGVLRRGLKFQTCTDTLNNFFLTIPGIFRSPHVHGTEDWGDEPSAALLRTNGLSAVFSIDVLYGHCPTKAIVTFHEVQRKSNFAQVRTECTYGHVCMYVCMYNGVQVKSRLLHTWNLIAPPWPPRRLYYDPAPSYHYTFTTAKKNWAIFVFQLLYAV